MLLPPPHFLIWPDNSSGQNPFQSLSSRWKNPIFWFPFHFLFLLSLMKLSNFSLCTIIKCEVYRFHWSFFVYSSRIMRVFESVVVWMLFKSTRNTLRCSHKDTVILYVSVCLWALHAEKGWKTSNPLAFLETSGFTSDYDSCLTMSKHLALQPQMSPEFSKSLSN